LNGTISICDEGSLIAISGCGMWSLDYADMHFADLKKIVEANRDLSGVARVLVDLRAAAVQTPAVADRIREWTNIIYRREDRVAVLVASTLLSGQLRRNGAAGVHFADVGEARAWLMRDDEAPALRRATR
jgi:hypothetical protein